MFGGSARSARSGYDEQPADRSINVLNVNLKPFLSDRNIVLMSLRLLSIRTTASIRRTGLISSHLPLPAIRTMASIPSTMKGVIIEKTGGTDVMQHKTDLPVPEPTEGQVLVKNDYLGVNYIDT